jgi:signal transduction histidine kinase
VGELSASIVHEVGQPLGAIVANTDAARLMLAGGEHDAAELQDIFADVRRDALRANEVLRHMRALLHKQANAVAPLDLNAAVDEAIVLLAPEARRRGITIEGTPLPDSTPFVGDRVQLQQVLLNLVLNAMDAMTDAPVPRRVVSVSLRSAGAGIELEVADRGHGIAAEHASKLFESFFTTKHDGMGLGLPIVRSVVGAHGGRVWAEPRDGGGTRFIVWLPRVAAAVHAASEPAPPRFEETPAGLAGSGERP